MIHKTPPFFKNKEIYCKVVSNNKFLIKIAANSFYKTSETTKPTKTRTQIRLEMQDILTLLKVKVTCQLNNSIATKLEPMVTGTMIYQDIQSTHWNPYNRKEVKQRWKKMSKINQILKHRIK